MFDNENVDNNYENDYSQVDDGYNTLENNYNTMYEDNGIVVNGYINNVLYNPEIDKYCLEIIYTFEGEQYVFYYRNITRDITYELDAKNLRKINVYLPNNSPEYAQIDEELLWYMIEN
ncbi:MAG: hypothetical protein IJN90_07410 [Bacilli bacterium]|nr:hypothetical protein [Bacilli bacterium]